MKRIFLVKSSTAITSPKISLRNIAGSSGRIDVICRSILNAFFIDVNDFRRNVTFYGVLEGPPDPPKTLCIDGFMVERMTLDEVWILEVIMDLMRGKSVKGFNIFKRGFQDVVRSLISDGVKLLCMHEDGLDIERYDFKYGFDYCFILGDQAGLDGVSERFLSSLNIPMISLGRIPYLTSQCVWLINYFLDKIGFD